MFTRTRLLVLVVLFLAGTSGWLGYLVYATPSATNVVVTPGQQGPCTWFVYLEGTTPFARAMVAGLSVSVGDNLAGTAGQDPAAFINTNLMVTNTAICLAPNTTFNAVSTLKMAGGSMLSGGGTSSTIWSCTGAIICIETNPNVNGPVLLDETIQNIEIDGSTTGITAALYIDCVQRLRVISILFGGGGSAYPAVLFQDTASCGTYENEIYNINFRASAPYNDSVILAGVNPGPEFLYASNLNVNLGSVLVRCSVLDVYGTELDQGPGIGASSTYFKLAKMAGCNFNPELIWHGGDLEPPASVTTAISLDANSRAYILANFALAACSQISNSGSLFFESMNAGTAQCNVNTLGPNVTLSKGTSLAQTTTQANICTYTPPQNGIFQASAYVLITAYTSGSVVATLTFTDTHAGARTQNLISVGSATFNSGTFLAYAQSGSAIAIGSTGTFVATYDLACSIVQTG